MTWLLSGKPGRRPCQRLPPTPPASQSLQASKQAATWTDPLDPPLGGEPSSWQLPAPMLPAWLGLSSLWSVLVTGWPWCPRGPSPECLATVSLVWKLLSDMSSPWFGAQSGALSGIPCGPLFSIPAPAAALSKVHQLPGQGQEARFLSQRARRVGKRAAGYPVPLLWKPRRGACPEGVQPWVSTGFLCHAAALFPEGHSVLWATATCPGWFQLLGHSPRPLSPTHGRAHGQGASCGPAARRTWLPLSL